MRDHRQGDEGASLLIVLVFIILISVLSLVLLDFSTASFQASSAVRDVRQADYAADAALELGIRKVVDDSTGTLGASGGPACSFALNGPNGLNTTVTCQPDGSAGQNPPNRPANALLTLGPNAFALSGNSPLGIGGSIYSHGSITTGQPFNILTSTSAVVAEGDGECSSVKVIGVPKVCTATGPQRATGGDPNWLSRAGSSFSGTLTTNRVPTCSGLVATFTAGTKFTTSPTILVSSIAACAAVRTLYFPAGVYYFENTGDIHTSPPVAGRDPIYDIVAGTPSGGVVSGSWTAGTVPAPTNGTACQGAGPPLLAVAPGPGAQFIFGGNSSLLIDNNVSSVTICGGLSDATKPAIAIYGVRTTDATTGLLAPSLNAPLVTSNNLPSVFVQGTVYAPLSMLTLDLHNRDRTYYSGGIVGYTVNLQVSASSTQLDSPISLPACSVSYPCRSNRRVIFTAAVAGDPWIHAVVDFNDGAGVTPAASYVIDSWSVLH